MTLVPRSLSMWSDLNKGWRASVCPLGVCPYCVQFGCLWTSNVQIFLPGTTERSTSPSRSIRPMECLNLNHIVNNLTLSNPSPPDSYCENPSPQPGSYCKRYPPKACLLRSLMKLFSFPSFSSSSSPLKQTCKTTQSDIVIVER